MFIKIVIEFGIIHALWLCCNPDFARMVRMGYSLYDARAIVMRQRYLDIK